MKSLNCRIQFLLVTLLIGLITSFNTFSQTPPQNPWYEESFKLKEWGSAYDEAGFSKNGNNSCDGKLVVSDFNGNIMYTYPISANKINGSDLTCTLNYSGVVPFTSFAYYDHGAKQWKKLDRNRAAWILGVNGFAVQVFSGAGFFMCKPHTQGTEWGFENDDYARVGIEPWADQTNFDDDDINWVVEGYDYCNTMVDHDGSNLYQDVIKILKADGSILELRNPFRSYSALNANNSEFFTGIYYESGIDAKGIAEVSFVQDCYLDQPPTSDFSVNQFNSCPHWARIVKYYPGDGMMYLFREYTYPWGRDICYVQDPTGNNPYTLDPSFETPSNLGKKLRADDGYPYAGRTFGSEGRATPKIFYLEEVHNKFRKIADFTYSRHHSCDEQDAEGINDLTIGRALLKSFSDHKITYNNDYITIETSTKTYTLNLGTRKITGWDQVVEGRALPDDYLYERFDDYQKATTYISSLDNTSHYYSWVDYISKISEKDITNGLDNPEKTTTFSYQDYNRFYSSSCTVQNDVPGVPCYSFPKAYPQGTTYLSFNDYRLSSIEEPSQNYNFVYKEPPSGTYIQIPIESYSPNTMLFCQFNVADEYFKRKKNGDYILKVEYEYDYQSRTTYKAILPDNAFARCTTSTYDYIKNTTTTKEYCYEDFLLFSPHWVQGYDLPYLKPFFPDLHKTHLRKTVETGAGITTTNYYSLLNPVINAKTLDYMFLPSSIKTDIKDNVTGFQKNKSYLSYEYPIITKLVDNDNKIRDYGYIDSERYQEQIEKISDAFGWEVKHERIYTWNPYNVNVGDPAVINPIFNISNPAELYKEKRTYEHLPKRTENVTVNENIFNYEKSFNEYQRLLYEGTQPDAQVKGRRFEDVLCKVAQFDQVQESIMTFPAIYKIPSMNILYIHGDEIVSNMLSFYYRTINDDPTISGEINYNYGNVVEDEYRGKNYTYGSSNNYYYTEGFKNGGLLYRTLPDNRYDTYSYKYYDYSDAMTGGYWNVPNDGTEKACSSLNTPSGMIRTNEANNDNIDNIKYLRLNEGLYQYSADKPTIEKTKIFKYGNIGGNVEMIEKNISNLFEYDATGNIKKSVDPNGWMTTFEYDIFGRIKKVNAPYDFTDYNNPFGVIPSPEKVLIKNNGIIKPTGSFYVEFAKPKDLTAFNNLNAAKFRIYLSKVLGQNVYLTVNFVNLGNYTTTFVFNTGDVQDNPADGILEVNLASKTSDIINLLNSGDRIKVELSTSTMGAKVEFANNSGDKLPSLALDGAINWDAPNNYTARNFTNYENTLMYKFNYQTLTSEVTTKLDDLYHNSENIQYNRREIKDTYTFGTDYKVLTSKRNNGVPDIFTYTGTGQLLSMTDKESKTTTYSYDALGRLTSTTLPDNAVESFQYGIGDPTVIGASPADYMGFYYKKSIINNKNVRLTQYYDALDRLRMEINDEGGPQQRITQYKYDIQNKLTHVINPKNQYIRYWYDDLGRIKYKYQTDMGITSYAYDMANNMRFSQTQEQAEDKRVTYYEYDGLKRILLIGEAKINSEVNPITFTPSSENLNNDNINLDRLTDILTTFSLNVSPITSLVCDNITLWMDPTPESLDYMPLNDVNYNDNCIPIIYRTANTLLGIDAKPPSPIITHKIKPQEDPGFVPLPADGFENVNAYPTTMRTVSFYDELPQIAGQVWSHFPAYDKWNALAPVVQGGVRKLRNQMGKVSAIAYREHGGQPFNFMAFSYDERGRVEAVVRYTQNVGFDATYYSYNSNNQVIAVKNADPLREYNTWYGYDGSGRNNKIWSLNPSAPGLCGSTAAWYPANPSYDRLARPAKPYNYDISYVYTVMDQLDNARYYTNYPSNYLYIDYTYDPNRKWLTNINASVSGNQYFNESITYDNNKLGLITGVTTQHAATDPVITLTAGYDNIGQLTSWAIPAYNIQNTTINYDIVGNRQSMLKNYQNPPGAYNSGYAYADAVNTNNNRLTLWTDADRQGTYSSTFSYNPNGSLDLAKRARYVSNPIPFSQRSSEKFKYNVFGMLERYSSTLQSSLFTTPDCWRDVPENNRTEWRYRYNPFGEREQKKMHYSPAWDYNGGVYPWAYYLLGINNEQFVVYNGFQISDPVYLNINNTTCPNNLLVQESRVFIYPTEYNVYNTASSINMSYKVDQAGLWQKYYNIYDHLGSVRSTIKMDMTFGSKVDYNPFGEVLKMEGDNRTTYIGKEKDFENRLGDFGVRKFEDKLSRFTSIDPLWEKYPGWSPYNYCMNNPLMVLDPSGKEITVSWSEEKKDENDNVISTTEFNVLYKDGRLWNKDGSEYIECNDFAVATLSHLNSMKTSGIPIVEARLNHLENSEKQIEIYDHSSFGGDGYNFVAPESMYNRDNGIPTGSNISFLHTYNLDEWPSDPSENRLCVLTHELLGHAWLNMIGLSSGLGSTLLDGKVSFNDIWSINIANEMARKQGLKPRTSYDDGKYTIPSQYLWK